MIDELSALRLLERRFPSVSSEVVIGIGDDTAALRPSGGKLLLATTDTQVENTHFTRSIISPEDLARRAVAVTLSDIGAMGGAPKYILSTAGLPDWLDEDYFEALTKGFAQASKEFGVELIGGNLTGSDTLFIDVTALGDVESDVVVRRSGANVGDSVFVSGTLGDAALALKMMRPAPQGGGPAPQGVEATLWNRYSRPTPRLKLGRELAVRGLVTAMIDVSDGLALDLERLTNSSGCGAVIDLNKIPLSPEYSQYAPEHLSETYSLALTGGEDYELLFTAQSAKEDEVMALREESGISISIIGRVTDTEGVRVLDQRGEEIKIQSKGFIHFK